MAAIHKQYTDEMHRQFGYFACWLPNTRLALGDVGRLHHHQFDKVTSLTQLGVRFQVGAASEPVDLEYFSAGQVELSVHGEAQLAMDAVAEPLATLSVTFNRANATLFQAASCTTESVLNLPWLEQELRRLNCSDSWRRDYVVVTELVRTGTATILISEQKGARADFRIDAGVLANGSLPVARASVGLSTTSAHGLAVKVIAPGGLTPLYRAVRLHRRFAADPRLVYRSDELPNSNPRDRTEDLELVAVTWSDLIGRLDGI